MKKLLLWSLVVVLALGFASHVSAQAVPTLIEPDYWDGESWIFLNQCPFDPGQACDPPLIEGFEFGMLDLDPGDDYYFTGVALPEGFGFDGMWFDVLVGGSVVGQVSPGPPGAPGFWPPGTLGIGPTKQFTIEVTILGGALPDDWDMFPIWLMWTPTITCGADFSMKPLLGEGPDIPEPATLTLLALGGVAALRRRRKS